MNFETITANLTSTDLPVFLFDIVPTLQSLYGILEDTKKEYERHNDIEDHDNIWTLVRFVESAVSFYHDNCGEGYMFDIMCDFYPDLSWSCNTSKNVCYKCEHYYKGKCSDTESKESLDSLDRLCPESKVLRSLIEVIEQNKEDYRDYDIDRVMLIVHDLITEVQQ